MERVSKDAKPHRLAFSSSLLIRIAVPDVCPPFRDRTGMTHARALAMARVRRIEGKSRRQSGNGLAVRGCPWASIVMPDWGSSEHSRIMLIESNMVARAHPVMISLGGRSEEVRK